MAKTFACYGNETVAAMVARRLAAAGMLRVEHAPDAELVFTYCTSQTALEDLYFDDRGLVQVAQKGALLVDLSASTPSFARELNAVAVVSDLVPVEAPIAVLDAGSPDAFADRRKLACFVGGDEEDVEKARPLLEAIVGSVRATGGVGSAQLARAEHTLQATAHIVAAVEADALHRAQRRSSASPDRLAEHATATSAAGDQVLCAANGGSFEGCYTVEMFMAELAAALSAADDVDLILPQAEACLHLLELLAVIGGADKAPAALALVYGEEARCAEQGLDWTRAEQTYADDPAGCAEADPCEGAGAEPDPYCDYRGYGSYSAN